MHTTKEEKMGPNEEHVREEFAREADIVRGMGGVITTGDLRAYGDMLNDAILMDYPPASPYNDPVWAAEETIHYLDMSIAIHFPMRHDDPDLWSAVRNDVRDLRQARLALWRAQHPWAVTSRAGDEAVGLASQEETEELASRLEATAPAYQPYHVERRR